MREVHFEFLPWGASIMRRLILAAGLSVGLILSPVASFAQGKEKVPVAASAPSARQLDLARRYFDAMHFEDAMMMVYENMDMMEVFGSEDDEASGLDSRAMSEAIREAVAVLSPKMVDAMVPIVATHFSEAELEAMVAFYESDIGKSVIDKSATLNGPLMQSVMGLVPDYVEDILDRYCTKTNCTPAMKDKLRKHAS
jgi:hypothetical protein